MVINNLSLQHCNPCTSDVTASQPGELLAVQLATGVWHRGLVIAYKRGLYFVYLVDIGQKHFTSIVCPIPSHIASIPFQVLFSFRVSTSLFSVIGLHEDFGA